MHSNNLQESRGTIMEFSASQHAALDAFRAVYDEIMTVQAQLDAATQPHRERLTVLFGQLTAIQGLPC
jgi:hypothetical protein